MWEIKQKLKEWQNEKYWKKSECMKKSQKEWEFVRVKVKLNTKLKLKRIKEWKWGKIK